MLEFVNLGHDNFKRNIVWDRCRKDFGFHVCAAIGICGAFTWWILVPLWVHLHAQEQAWCYIRPASSSLSSACSRRLTGSVQVAERCPESASAPPFADISSSCKWRGISTTVASCARLQTLLCWLLTYCKVWACTQWCTSAVSVGKQPEVKTRMSFNVIDKRHQRAADDLFEAQITVVIKDGLWHFFWFVLLLIFQLKSVTMTLGNTQRATAPSSSSFPNTQRSWSGGSLRFTRRSWCKVHLSFSVLGHGWHSSISEESTVHLAPRIPTGRSTLLDAALMFLA